MRLRTLFSLVALLIVSLAPVVTARSADAATLQTWDRLASCESGGHWHINSGNGFYGGLQFSSSTWAGYGGHRYARQASGASRIQQVRIAEKVKRAQGWGAWPVCSRKIGVR